MSQPDAPQPTTVVDGLAVYDFGGGEPLLLMPGPQRLQPPGTLITDAIITGLVSLRRRVITFDPPASGLSTRKARLSIAELHRDASEALAASGIDGPVDAFGHSMGGFALLAYAIQHPERIRRLVLVGTTAGGPAYIESAGALWNSTHPAFQQTTALILLNLLYPTLATQKLLTNRIQRESFVNKRFVVPEPVRARDWFRRKRARTDWHRIVRRIDLSGQLGAVRVPTLVICGSEDPQFPPGASHQLASGIAGAQLIILEQTGHYPFLESPGAFWPIVGEFLAQPLPMGAAPSPAPAPEAAP